MKNVFFYISFILLLIIYIYSLVFKVFPISSKIILEILGLFYCLFRYGNQFKIKKEYISIIKFILIIVLWDITTCFLNGSTEFHLTKVALPIIGSVFGGQMLFAFSEKKIHDVDHFLFFVVLAIFLESVLTIVMKLFPGVYGFMDSLLVFELGRNTNIQDIYQKARFYGIGNAIYFGVLPSCSLGVMISVYIMITTSNTIKRIVSGFMFLTISITSFFVARTAIAIVAISVLLLLLYLKKTGAKKTLKILLFFPVVIAAVYFLVSSYLAENEELVNWALGFIINKDTESGTAGQVIEWWKETRFGFRTFLIGDAQYTDHHGGYYMHVDIGFFREIFYGGIIGLFLNLYLHFKVLKQIYKNKKDYFTKYMMTSLFLCYMIVLAKGDANMVTYFILLLVFYTGGVYEKRSVASSIIKTK